MDDTKTRWNDVIGITLAGLLVTAGLAACEQSQPDADTKKEAPAIETKSEPAADETMKDMPAAGEAMEDTSSAVGEAK